MDGGWVSGAFLMPLQRIGRGQGKKTEYAENGTKNPPDFLLKSEIWVMKSSEILQSQREMGTVAGGIETPAVESVLL